MQTQSLHTRAMLVSLNISSWTARKYDKKVSKEVADAHGADIEAGRYNKHLLPTTADINKQKAKAAGLKVKAADQTPNSYKDLMTFISEVRAWHATNTLPWSNEGQRVLTVANYQTYVDYIRAAQHKFHTMLDAFIRDYPSLRAEAERILNGMFNREDYPDSVAERFDFGFKIDPIPTSGDWRVELSDEEIKVLAASTEQRAREAFENAQADAVKRLFNLLAKINERLSTTETCDKCKGKGRIKDVRRNPTFGKLVTCWTCAGKGEVGGTVCGTCQGNKPEGSRVTKTEDTREHKNNGKTVDCWICGGAGKTAATFRDSLVDNARELVDVLKRLNVADDPQLEEYRRETEKLATSATADTLRDDENIRAATAKKAQSILAAMNSTYGAKLFT